MGLLLGFGLGALTVAVAVPMLASVTDADGVPLIAYRLTPVSVTTVVPLFVTPV